MTGTVAGGMPWGRAIIRAAIAVVVSLVLFVIVPDRLLAYLSLHIVPFWRDLLMLGYVAVAFVAGCLVFMRLQRVRA
jgi:hypothetical protein